MNLSLYQKTVLQNYKSSTQIITDNKDEQFYQLKFNFAQMLKYEFGKHN